MSDERVAALEAHREGDRSLLVGVSSKLDAVADDVAEIKLGLAKQKGFYAGILAVLLPIWTVITIAASTIWEWYQGGGTHQ